MKEAILAAGALLYAEPRRWIVVGEESRIPERAVVGESRPSARGRWPCALGAAGLLVLCCGPLPAGAGPARDETARASVVEVVRSALSRSGTPGAAVAVVVDDRVALAEGLGVLSAETGMPVTPDALFQIGSMTKVFTAAAVLVAAERGLVDLERPLGGSVRGLAPCLARVTLGQLLSHTAGLIDEPDEYGPHDEDALAAYARSWNEEYCLLAPGRAFSYSNSGFALAGLALQEATGKPYADAVSELVFAPLGMTRTTFRPTAAITYPVAVGHRVVEGRPVVVRPMADDARLWPAGEIFSSARELARFAVAFLNQGRLEGRQALPPSVVRRMLQPRGEVTGLGSHYGCGMFLDDYRGLPRAGHDGTLRCSPMWPSGCSTSCSATPLRPPHRRRLFGSSRSTLGRPRDTSAPSPTRGAGRSRSRRDRTGWCCDSSDARCRS